MKIETIEQIIATTPGLRLEGPAARLIAERLAPGIETHTTRACAEAYEFGAHHFSDGPVNDVFLDNNNPYKRRLKEQNR